MTEEETAPQGAQPPAPNDTSGSPADSAADSASASELNHLLIGANSGQSFNNVTGGVHNYAPTASSDERDWPIPPNAIAEFQDGFIAPSFVTGANRDEIPLVDMARMLAENGLLIIVGPRGSSRRTTAINVLSATGVQSIRELARPKAETALEEISVAAREGILLDVTNADLHSGFCATRAADAIRLKAANSCLAVLIDEETWSRVGDGARSFAARLKGPDPGVLLLDRLSRHDHMNDAKDWVEHADVQTAMSGAAPADVERFATLVNGVNTNANTKDLPLWDRIRHALRDYFKREDDLRSWFEEHPDIDARCFLIATAALEGRTSDAVFGAARDLADAVARENDDERPGLFDGRGAHALVKLVDAELVPHEWDPSGPKTLVQFRQAGYASSVIEFVLHDRSQAFMAACWNWLADLPLRVGLAQATAKAIGDLALRAAAQDSRPGLVTFIALKWASRPSLQLVATDLIVRAAEHTTLGQFTRDQLWEVSRALSLPPQALVAVANVCGTSFADNYPSMALTRLRHLARHRDQEVRRAVNAALRLIWERPRLRLELARDLLRWNSPGDDAESDRLRYRTAAEFLLWLIDPESADQPLTELGDKDQLLLDTIAAGIAAVLDHRSIEPFLCSTLGDILIRLDTEPDNGARVVDLLLNAAVASPARASRRITLERAAQQAGPGCKAAAQLTTRLIDVNTLRRPLARSAR